MLILDTHVFLWAMHAPEKLGPKTRALIQDSGTELYLSSVVAWEIAIKWGLGKLELPEEPIHYIPRKIRDFQLVELPVSARHAAGVAAYPPHHADPFDRLLICQSQTEAIPILTADPIFRSYPIQIVDAKR